MAKKHGSGGGKAHQEQDRVKRVSHDAGQNITIGTKEVQVMVDGKPVTRSIRFVEFSPRWKNELIHRATESPVEALEARIGWLADNPKEHDIQRAAELPYLLTAFGDKHREAAAHAFLNKGDFASAPKRAEQILRRLAGTLVVSENPYLSRFVVNAANIFAKMQNPEELDFRIKNGFWRGAEREKREGR